MKYLCFALMLSLSSPASAREVQLFYKGPDGSALPIEGYNEAAKDLQYGDWLAFSDGYKVQIGKRLGQGGRAYIFELLNDPRKVIRISNKDHFNLRAIDSTIDGYALLRAKKVPVVRLYRWSRSEYVIGERLPGHPFSYSFDDLVHSKVPYNLRNKMMGGLFDFAMKTEALRRIGDARQEQMRYLVRENRWILMDWMEHHELARSESASERAPRGLDQVPTLFDVGHIQRRFVHFFDPYLSADGDPIRPEHAWIRDLSAKLAAVTRKERARVNLYARGADQCPASFSRLNANKGGAR